MLRSTTCQQCPFCPDVRQFKPCSNSPPFRVLSPLYALADLNRAISQTCYLDFVQAVAATSKTPTSTPTPQPAAAPMTPQPVTVSMTPQPVAAPLATEPPTTTPPVAAPIQVVTTPVLGTSQRWGAFSHFVPNWTEWCVDSKSLLHRFVQQDFAALDRQEFGALDDHVDW